MTTILLAVGDVGQFFVDPVTGIQIGEMWEKDDGWWAVYVNDEVQAVASREVAIAYFLVTHDPRKLVYLPSAVATDDDGVLDDYVVTELTVPDTH